jgi:hypothetical protein
MVLFGRPQCDLGHSPGLGPAAHSVCNLINGCGTQPPETEGENAMTSIRTALAGTVVAAALLASSAAGFAQGTSEQRSACMGDAFKYCSAHIPNVSAVTTCMKANYSKLSAACKATAPKS